MKNGNKPGVKKNKRMKVCKCGNYKPTSTKGLIILKCKNCGGEKPLIRYK